MFARRLKIENQKISEKLRATQYELWEMIARVNQLEKQLEELRKACEEKDKIINRYKRVRDNKGRFIAKKQ